HVAVQHFEDAANRGLGRERVECGDLEGVFVGNIRVERGELCCVGERTEWTVSIDERRDERERRYVVDRRSDTINAGKVALAVDLVVPLIGYGRVERAVGIAQVRTDGVAERTVVTSIREKSAAGRIVAARTITSARREIVADVAAV